MKYLKITPNRFDDVIQYLRYTFFADEPLNKSVKLCKAGEEHHESEKYSKKTLEDGLSVMAVNNDDEVSSLFPLNKQLYFKLIFFLQQIAGVALNGVVTKESTKHAMDDLQQRTDEKFKKILYLLCSQNLKVNLFKEFDVDELFETRILSVNPKFRGQGVAKNLLLTSEDVAREHGFKVKRD